MGRKQRIFVLVFSGMVGLVLGVFGLLAGGLFVAKPPPLAISAANGKTLTLELTEAFLASRLNEGKEDSPLMLRDVQVTIRDDGTVFIKGAAAPARGGPATPTNGRPALPLPINPGGGSGIAVPVELTLRPAATDGKVAVEVVRANLGPIPIPTNIGRLLEDPINSQLGNAMQQEPFRITNLTTRQGALIVQAEREPR